MFRTIVIAIDGSDFAQRAVPVGTTLARRGGANVRAVAIARNDAEIDWTYKRVFEDANLDGLDPAEIDFLVDPDPAKALLEKTAADDTVLSCDARSTEARHRARALCRFRGDRTRDSPDHRRRLERIRRVVRRRRRRRTRRRGRR
jgi:nucleotide-binding universal stress UspA family protein